MLLWGYGALVIILGGRRRGRGAFLKEALLRYIDARQRRGCIPNTRRKHITPHSHLTHFACRCSSSMVVAGICSTSFVWGLFRISPAHTHVAFYRSLSHACGVGFCRFPCNTNSVGRRNQILSNTGLLLVLRRHLIYVYSVDACALFCAVPR